VARALQRVARGVERTFRARLEIINENLASRRKVFDFWV